MPLPSIREVRVGTVTLNIVTFQDLRDPASEMEEFLFQSEVQQFLFGTEGVGTTGALYRLLQRAGVGARALPLRRTSVAAGLVSDEAFEYLRDCLHSGVRVFTLIPLSVLRTAIARFGRAPQSEMLLASSVS